MTERPPTQPPRDAFVGDDRITFDQVVTRLSPGWRPGSDVTVGGYFGALLQSPPLCDIVSRMGTFTRASAERGDGYSHADREFAAHVVAVELGSDSVAAGHIDGALSAGVRAQALKALRQEHLESLNDDERILVRFIRGVLTGDLAQDVYVAIEDRFGIRALLEYAAHILWMQWTIRFLQIIGLPGPTREDVDKKILELAEDLSSKNMSQRIC